MTKARYEKETKGCHIRKGPKCNSGGRDLSGRGQRRRKERGIKGKYGS